MQAHMQAVIQRAISVGFPSSAPALDLSCTGPSLEI